MFDQKNQKELFETIFYKSTDGMLIVKDGIFIECNDAVVKMLNYKNKEEFLNTRAAEISPEFQPDGISSHEKAEENTKIILKNGSHDFEWVHLKSNGTPFWVNVVVTDISPSEGRTFLVVWRDIDDQVKMALELKKLNENLEEQVKEKTVELKQYSDILSKHVIYSRADLHGVILDVSEAFCEISGFSRSECIGVSHNIVRHPDMPVSLYDDLWQTIRSKKVWTGVIKNLKKDGSYYWVDIRIEPVLDSQGEIQSYISVRHDITSKMELKSLNANLEEVIAQEIKKNRDKDLKILEKEKMARMGEMIGNIAHQWRQPLSAIAAIASRVALEYELGIEDDDETISDSMVKVTDNCDYLSETINTFRNYLKDHKKVEVIVLQELLGKALNIVRPSILDNHIKLHVNVNTKTPIHMRLAAGELMEVIINIMNNARDILMETKTVEPWVKVEMYKEDKKVTISVEDNGKGIPKEILAKIFEPYFTTKHKSSGTGLGLHMSYNIIHDSLEGELYVENTENGAKFFIELPLKEA